MDTPKKKKLKFTLPKTITRPEARRTMLDVVHQIEEGRELEAADIPQLHRMATAYNAYIDCVHVLSEKGLTMVNLKGETVKRPEANLLKENWNQYLELMKEYGLTIKSRSRIKGKAFEKEEDSPADLYFKSKLNHD